MVGSFILNLIKEYPEIFLFYAFIIVLLFLFRKKIDTQAKFIFLYRMKWGLQWMDKYSQKYREWVILLGYIGVGAGFIGLLLISVLLLKNLYDLIIMPTAVSGVSLVLPGINVPGLGILPFWDWILAIFVIALVHEFGHGLVARAHQIEVKNTGLVLFGPVLGAFVEPNEKKLRKESDIIQYSVLAAGAFSNVLLACLALLFLAFLFAPLQQEMVNPVGFTFGSYYEGDFPFAQNQIKPGTLITGLNEVSTPGFQDFGEELSFYKPGDIVKVVTKDQTYSLTLAANPENEKKSFLGIKEIKNEFEIKEKYQSGFWKVLYYFNNEITSFLKWLYLLSLGIGLFNLLPLPIVDGGRMTQVFLQRLKGSENGDKKYQQISLFFLLVLFLNLVFPFILKLFN